MIELPLYEGRSCGSQGVAEAMFETALLARPQCTVQENMHWFRRHESAARDSSPGRGDRARDHRVEVNTGGRFSTNERMASRPSGVTALCAMTSTASAYAASTSS